jgi:tRNA A-37 threonylcarbamoyl transferase component Bud32
MEKALDMIHEAGMLHGDLHKRKILVAPNGQVFLLDFDGSKLRASHEDVVAEKATMT